MRLHVSDAPEHSVVGEVKSELSSISNEYAVMLPSLSNESDALSVSVPCNQEECAGYVNMGVGRSFTATVILSEPEFGALLEVAWHLTSQELLPESEPAVIVKLNSHPVPPELSVPQL